LIHGDQDPLVPHDQSVRLYKALKKEGVEACFITVTGAGHGGFRNPEVARRIRQFLDVMSVNAAEGVNLGGPGGRAARAKH